MAYRLRYVVFADWIGPGQGQLTSAQYPGQAGAGNAQTLQLQNVQGGQNIVGTGSGGAIAAADITTLTNAMAADILAQMNAQPTFGRLGNFSTGQP
jgi:predicted outer membrane repeat protein